MGSLFLFFDKEKEGKHGIILSANHRLLLRRREGEKKIVYGLKEGRKEGKKEGRKEGKKVVVFNINI